MTAHANCTHEATKTARATCRRAAAIDAANPMIKAVDIPTDGLFIHPTSGDTVRAIAYEFGYVKYQPADEPIPTGLNNIFTEIAGSTLVRPVAA